MVAYWYQMPWRLRLYLKYNTRPKVVVQILAQPGETFVSILRVLDDFLSPERVFMEERQRRIRRVKRE